MKKITSIAVLLFMIAAHVSAADADSLYAQNLLKPGEEAPQFTIVHEDTIMNTRLSDYRGRYVVLDFWASWCPDCRRDIPEMKRLRDEYAKKGVFFISVSFDTNKDVWQKCIKDNKMEWLQYSELKKWKETKISGDYHISWIPTMYLIDKEGKVDMGTVETNKLEARLSQIEPADTTHDHMPSFPGGVNGIVKCLSKNLTYPSIAQKMGMEGKVVVDFLVEKDGGVKVVGAKDCVITSVGKKYKKLSQAEQQTIKEQVSLLFAKEAARVVRNMPNWEPAVDYGVPVRVLYHVPVAFRLK